MTNEEKYMENDLISRSALKASIPEPSNITQRMVYRTLCNLIDNAPTVELTETDIQEVLNKRR